MPARGSTRHRSAGRRPAEDQRGPGRRRERGGAPRPPRRRDRRRQGREAAGRHTWGSTGHAAADEALRIIQNVGLSTMTPRNSSSTPRCPVTPRKVDQKALASKIGPRRTKAIMQALETFSTDMRPRDERISNEVWQYSNGPKALERLVQQGMEKLARQRCRGTSWRWARAGHPLSAPWRACRPL
jgi:hypothetical protein